jgi:Flp pilus assembly protein TadD
MIIRITSGKNFLLSAILLFQATAIAVGQIAGGLTGTTNTRMGGNNYVVGTVFGPTGMPVNTRISIRLSTPEFGDVITSTDDGGKFVFSGVGNGLYTLIIDSEPDFEPVREEVDIVRKRSSVPETYTLTIRLRDRIDLRTKAERPAVIKASDAAVPKPALKYYEKAAELARSADHRGAIEQLKLAVEAYPLFVNAWNEIGVQYLRLNELDRADEALQAALKIKPDAYEPLINRGIALFRLSRLKDAEPVLRDALKAKAESSVAYYYLGRTLNKMGRNDEAEIAFLTCIKMSPGEFKEAHRLLAVIYLDRGDGQRVIEELEQYLLLVPKAPDAEELRKVIEQIKRASKIPESGRKPGT